VTVWLPGPVPLIQPVTGYAVVAVAANVTDYAFPNPLSDLRSPIGLVVESSLLLSRLWSLNACDRAIRHCAAEIGQDPIALFALSLASTCDPPPATRQQLSVSVDYGDGDGERAEAL
jgi:hypothetical protein